MGCFGGGTNTTTQVTNQTTTPTATPEERELNQLEIERQKATQQGLINTRQSGLELINQLLQGNDQLPGFFTELSGGISEEMTNEIAANAVRDIPVSLQTQGLSDSGLGQVIAARVAGDVRRATQEFNIGNKLNLLNLALSGQAQVQQPILYESANLGSRLAGLRSVNTSGTTSTTTPYASFGQTFLNNFATSLGQTAGGARL